MAKVVSYADEEALVMPAEDREGGDVRCRRQDRGDIHRKQGGGDHAWCRQMQRLCLPPTRSRRARPVTNKTVKIAAHSRQGRWRPRPTKMKAAPASGGGESCACKEAEACRVCIIFL